MPAELVAPLLRQSSAKSHRQKTDSLLEITADAQTLITDDAAQRHLEKLREAPNQK